MTDGNGRSALDRAGQTKKQGAAFRKESGALPCAGQKENPQPMLMCHKVTHKNLIDNHLLFRTKEPLMTV